MKIKLLVAITALMILGGIIYFEQSNTPYNNFDVITNNSNLDTKTIDIGASLEKKYQTQKQKKSDNIQTSSNTTKTYSRTTIELPNFPITIIGNKNIKTIYEVKAKKIIIHFWASWCNICKSEFNDLVKYTKLNADTAVIAISVDDERDLLGKYLDELNNKYHINNIKNLYFSWDHDKSISLDLFGTQMLPENYIVTHHDNIYEVEEKTVGKTNWAELLKANAA